MNNNAHSCFEFITEHLARPEKEYKYNFNYAACELWLCNEICKALNQNPSIWGAEDDKAYAYNERQKVDIGLFDEQGEFSEIVEVKVVYPALGEYSLENRDNYLSKLKNKLENERNIRQGDLDYHGWVFYVWTSYEEYEKRFVDPAVFFAAHSPNHITKVLGAGFESADGFEMRDILDEVILWRGDKKTITVKAIQFNLRT